MPNRAGAVTGLLTTLTAEADSFLRLSAADAGGERRLRYITDAGCTPQILAVEINPLPEGEEEAKYGEVVAQLKAKGFDRTDRKYLVFVDSRGTSCGLGSRQPDDSPDPGNKNNFGPSYALVFNTCWQTGRTAGHELMHTLGAVQASAPHSSLGGHCADKYDIMCYRDRPDSPPTVLACPDEALYSTRYDCGHDDYFNPAALPGSYLATHWNAANHQFLVGGRAPGDGAPIVGRDRVKHRDGKRRPR